MSLTSSSGIPLLSEGRAFLDAWNWQVPSERSPQLRKDLGDIITRITKLKLFLINRLLIPELDIDMYLTTLKQYEKTENILTAYIEARNKADKALTR